MVLVLLMATALRLWALPDLPLGLHYDEAANAILTRQIAAGDYRPIFIRAYTGKEVLFFYAAAPWMWMTGGAAWGLRLGAAMLGILTVAATFSATRALLGRGHRSQTIALLAAGWVAVAFPHVLLSRYGFRAISQPLLQALTVAALWRGLRSGKRRWLAVAGALLGLTGYTYLAARLFPFPIALAMGWMLVRTPQAARIQRFRQLLLVFTVALIAFAPLGRYFLQNPDAFTTRIAQVAAPTWCDALRGLWRCVRALVWPGAGDPYVRFNLPGKPVLDALSAVLALVGLGGLLFAPRKAALDSAARVFVVAVLATMLLPSALATSEITPSNLRLVGLFPFIAILPAYALAQLTYFSKTRLAPHFSSPRHASGTSPAPRRWPEQVRDHILSLASYSPTSHTLLLASCLLLIGGTATGLAYHQWATSAALFYAADGEMVLAAEALDALSAPETTVYIASEHYRHPTVAALAQRYPQAKWLTGGATLVLPPAGDAVYLLPRTQPPPALWPGAISQAWTSTPLLDPDGTPALWMHHLTAEDVGTLRPADPVADFAHVVRVYAAQPLQPCRVAEPCPVLVTWEALAPYSALQPVVRLLHPRTGEWARTMAFHYPPEQWTVGDVIVDQLVFVPPVGTPPGEDYQIGVGFFNPDSGEALPRLAAERFAGLEVRFPADLILEPMLQPPTAAQATRACAGIPRQASVGRDGLRLTGWTSPPAVLRPGEAMFLRLCWQAMAQSLPEGDVTLALVGPETRALYTGAPAGDFAFSLWRSGEIVEGRYPLRVPRDIAAGHYALTLSVGAASVVELGIVEVRSVVHNFSVPEMQHVYEVDFGASIRLRGYDVEVRPSGSALDVTLYWQSLAEVAEDYVVFVHLLDQGTGQLVAQIDEAPQNGDYPTSLWVAGEIVIDRHTLSAPNNLPAGTPLLLRVGFYLQETGDFLAVDGAADALLPPVMVGP